MRPTKAFGISLGLVAGMLLTVASMSVGLEGCAHVVNFVDDAKTCFGPDVKGDLGDLIQGVETALVCDLTSGGGTIPACVTEGLQTIAQEIGPSGSADVECVVAKLAQQGASAQTSASPTDVIRQQRAKLIVARGGLAMLGRGARLDSTKTRGARLALPGADGASRETSLADAREPAGMPDGPAATLAVAPLPSGAAETSRRPTEQTIQRAAKSIDETRAHGETRQSVSMSEGRPALSFAYHGPNVGTELASCDRDCGDNAHNAIAPGGHCECWRKVGSTWRWVAAQ